MNRVIILLFWTLLIINAVILIVTIIDLWPNNPFHEYSFLLVISFLTLGGFLRQKIKKKY